MTTNLESFCPACGSKPAIEKNLYTAPISGLIQEKSDQNLKSIDHVIHYCQNCGTLYYSPGAEAIKQLDKLYSTHLATPRGTKTYVAY